MCRSLSIIMFLALVLSTNAAAADKPTKVEIGKPARPPPLFVDVPKQGSGTILRSPSGLFVTNEHVVRAR